MSLDTDTKIAFAEELEDIAMELANISMLPPSGTEENKNLKEKTIFQSIKAETERLIDIAEFFEYTELLPITHWLHSNILALEAKTDLLAERNETGLFFTWIELLAALLQSHEDDLATELTTSLQHDDWQISIDNKDLKNLIQSLSTSSEVAIPDTPDSQPASENSTRNDNSVVTDTSYVLAWDKDVHPELLEAFFIEAPDQVTEVAELIRNISSGKADNETHQSAARVAHTIKGSSAVVGIEAVATLAHKLEDILEYSVEHDLPEEVSNLLIESADCLEAMFDSLLMANPAPPQYPYLVEQLTQWSKRFEAGYITDKPAADSVEPAVEEKEAETSELPLQTPPPQQEIDTEDYSYSLAWDKDVHPELLEAYLGETPDLISRLAKQLRTIHNNQINNKTTASKTYQQTSRLAHTIKGASAVVGVTAISDLSLQIEDILDYASEDALSPKLTELLNDSAGLLEALLESLLSKKDQPEEYPELYAKLCEWEQHTLVTRTNNTPASRDNTQTKQSTVVVQAKETDTSLADQTPAKIETDNNAKETDISDKEPNEAKANSNIDTERQKDNKNTDFTIKTLDLPPLQEILPVIMPQASKAGTTPVISRKKLNQTMLRVPVSVIENLLSFSSELITANTQMADQMSTLLRTRTDIAERDEHIRGLLDELEWAVNKQMSSGSKHQTNPHPTNNKVTDFDSLEMDSYNELHSITGLLSESIEDSREMSMSLIQQLSELKGHVHRQKQVNKELNTSVLNMRMERVKILTPRLERIIRETCRSTNKKAELEIIGSEIAIDTDVIKSLVDPLLHLLRNAVDHGIESPELRKEKNKDETGLIKLIFELLGDQVAVTLTDDGLGINPEKIYQTAINKGLIEKGTSLTDQEKLHLILLPGFTTREQVTDISGRGVGMDVVNSAIKNISGSVSITSNIDKGSEIRLQVPLTLSTTNILLVKVQKQIVAIPNVNIQQVHHLTSNDIEEQGERLYFYHQDEHIQLLSLSTLLSWSASKINANRNQSVLIVEHQQKQYAMYVDEIIKSQEITLKTLKPWVTTISGINGVCLLPNGVVAPVLNLYELLDAAPSESFRSPIYLTDSAYSDSDGNKILVVDDSLSNRKALSLMIEAISASGNNTEYEVVTAVDGIDALKQIERTQFHLIITDLEMPNMNGLELVESLRTWPETKTTPVVMVTSRSTDKHRQLAARAGVNDYLTKPVDTTTLQSVIDKYNLSLATQKTA